MWERYQDRANAAPGMIYDADNIFSNNPFLLNRQYQSVANAFPNAVMRAEDVPSEYAPIRADLRAAQNIVNSFPQRIVNADEIRLGRASGSVLRSVRGLGGLGSLGCTACENADAQTTYSNMNKWHWIALGGAVVAGGVVGFMLRKKR